jgi:hypothetical protein
MKTKLWHIGIASVVFGATGLAHAQTNPTPGISQEPIEAPSVMSPGNPSDAYSGSQGVDSSPNWDNSQADPSQGVNQAPLSSDATGTNVPPADSLAGVDARGDQSVESSDGMLVPPAFSTTGSSSNK